MRMMDELRHMFLYPATKKVYAPVDELDKRRGASILLLTPNLDISNRLMNLPYIHNPKLFTSFYIDRNVMAYIDNIGINEIEDFDEIEEENISESMYGNSYTKAKFVFDDNMSTMDKKYVECVFNTKTADSYIKQLQIKKINDKIKIFVHPNISSLQNNASKNIRNIYKDNLYSYSDKNEIHVISKMVYDPELIGGTYEIYLKEILIYHLIHQYNDKLNFDLIKSISSALSGKYDWINKRENNYSKQKYDKLANLMNNMIKNNKIKDICKYINTDDISVFPKYIQSYIMKNLKTQFSTYSESELSYSKRKALEDSEFGLPEKRAYPMPDIDHVKAAIRMFNRCDKDDEEELANSIIKKIKKFKIDDINIGNSNRFKKYYDMAFNESYSMMDSDYADILKICSHLSQDEFKKISFYDTYRNSQFVIKRIIHKDGIEPVGFLDVYQFPSRPEIAQITIAVDNRFRGNGIADKMIKKLMNSGLEKSHNFTMYYWTAHGDNEASQNLALKHHFINIDKKDRYGRNIFIKPVTVNVTESAFNNNLVILDEADSSQYSSRLKKYLYKERIKNNKNVVEMYDKIKSINPNIKRTYIKLNMYKKLNIFIDLSHYNALFLKNNIYVKDKAVNFYFDFINRLINNKEIDSEYKKKTIFIPVDGDVWTIEPNTELSDYRRNLNPISIITRLIRTNPSALKRAWGNKDIVFVGSRGYFKVDFNKFELRNLNRFVSNIRKLSSVNEPIDDEYETDDLNHDIDVNGNETIDDKNIDSPKAMAVKIIDKIEDKTDIKIDNISSINNINKSDNNILINKIQDPLKIINNPISTKDVGIKDNKNIAIITIDPDGSKDIPELNKHIFKNIKVNTYCIL